jgi:type I restriction enzyme R subunit
MTFTEANTVEEFFLGRMTKSGWTYVFGPELLRSNSDVLLEPILTEALCALNPEIAEDSSLADEVVYKLRAVIQGVGGDGLVRANEELMAWIRGERTMPFGPNGEHVTIRLVDFDDLSRNSFIVSNQVTFAQGPQRRFDLVGFVNGIPLVVKQRLPCGRR